MLPCVTSLITIGWTCRFKGKYRKTNYVLCHVNYSSESLFKRALTVGMKTFKCIIQNVQIFLQGRDNLPVITTLCATIIEVSICFRKHVLDQGPTLFRMTHGWVNKLWSDLSVGLICLFMKLWECYRSPQFSKIHYIVPPQDKQWDFEKAAVEQQHAVELSSKANQWFLEGSTTADSYSLLLLWGAIITSYKNCYDVWITHWTVKCNAEDQRAAQP